MMINTQVNEVNVSVELLPIFFRLVYLNLRFLFPAKNETRIKLNSARKRLPLMQEVISIQKEQFSMLSSFTFYYSTVRINCTLTNKSVLVEFQPPSPIQNWFFKRRFFVMQHKLYWFIIILQGIFSQSNNDLQMTKRLKEVGELLELPVLDHVIITEESFYSFCRWREDVNRVAKIEKK